MATTIMIDWLFCWIFTPWLRTDCGNWGSAVLTRFSTSVCARAGFLLMSKKMLSVMFPAVLVEYMYSIPSAPLTWSSMGEATFCETVSAFAPG